MLPRDTIDRFETPAGQELALVSRGTDFFIELDNQELMSTRRTGSEIALAEIGCQNLEGVAKPRVLIGGLGLGYTLRAALERLPAHAKLVVAELFPQVVAWNQTHLKSLYGKTLADPRLQIVVRDVWNAVGRGPWSSILLDTDNGPQAYCLPRNNRLYGHVGLERLRNSLVKGGTLAIWSADTDQSFVKRMRAAGFEARCDIVRAHKNKGQRYAIFVGRKPR